MVILVVLALVMVTVTTVLAAMVMILMITMVIFDFYHCRTALHYAAGHVHYLCVKSLVASGCNVNKADTRGCTPLHYAAATDRDAK